MSDDLVTLDKLFEISVKGTFREFAVAARKFYGSAIADYTEERFKRLHKTIAEHDLNPYKKQEVKKPVPPKMRIFRVTFARIGSNPDYRGWSVMVQATEIGATVAPITKIVNGIFEDEYEIPQANIQVTLVDDKGQINYGLIGEFTVVDMGEA